MNHIRAENWLRELEKAVQNKHLTLAQAHDEVLAEMEHGDHEPETETLYFNFTRGIPCN
jgi:hypothetical protein